MDLPDRSTGAAILATKAIVITQNEGTTKLSPNSELPIGSWQQTYCREIARWQGSPTTASGAMLTPSLGNPGLDRWVPPWMLPEHVQRPEQRTLSGGPNEGLLNSAHGSCPTATKCGPSQEGLLPSPQKAMGRRVIDRHRAYARCPRLPGPRQAKVSMGPLGSEPVTPQWVSRGVAWSPPHTTLQIIPRP